MNWNRCWNLRFWVCWVPLGTCLQVQVLERLLLLRRSAALGLPYAYGFLLYIRSAKPAMPAASYGSIRSACPGFSLWVVSCCCLIYGAICEHNCLTSYTRLLYICRLDNNNIYLGSGFWIACLGLPYGQHMPGLLISALYGLWFLTYTVTNNICLCIAYTWLICIPWTYRLYIPTTTTGYAPGYI